MLERPYIKVDLSSNSTEYNRVLKLFTASNPKYEEIVKVCVVYQPIFTSQSPEFWSWSDKRKTQMTPILVLSAHLFENGEKTWINDVIWSNGYVITSTLIFLLSVS